jgi:hypothetical protein
VSLGLLHEASPRADTGRRWRLASYGYALLVAAGLGYFLVRVPIQVTDCFANMLALDEPFGALMRRVLDDRSYLRPGLWAALKAVYDLAGGQYFYWFRLTHVVQVLLVIVLFVRLADPRSLTEAAALPLGLAALIGSHTFAWTVREAFPINTFLTIVVCCAAAANIACARHRWWTDVLAALLFAFAVLTVESGVLVWVIFACGYLVGLRGISRRGLLVVTVLLAGYFALRMSLDVGVPGLIQREAGFGFTRRSGHELEALFGANPLPFYAYNVAASVLGVLFAEPRDGVWRLVRATVHGARDLPAIVNVVSSTLATAVIGWFAWSRRAAWIRGELDRRDRIVLLFGAVLIAKAAVSYAYTKDVIMSPAGFFFAAAVFVAASQLFERLAHRRSAAALAAWVLVVALSSTWAVRALGVHAALAATSVTVREQWANVDDWIARQVGPLDAQGVNLKRQLQDDAIVRFPQKPPLRDEWTVLFDLD